MCFLAWSNRFKGRWIHSNKRIGEKGWGCDPDSSVHSHMFATFSSHFPPKTIRIFSLSSFSNLDNLTCAFPFLSFICATLQEYL